MKDYKKSKIKHRKILRRILLAALLLISAALLSYPFISDYVNSHNAKSEIKTYQQDADNLEQEQYDTLLEQAHLYNELLAKDRIELADAFGTEDSDLPNVTDNDGTLYDYNTLLSVNDSGVMAYLEIPSIRVYLPIFHGSSESVLQSAVGHLEGSSLPVGGESTHAVLSGHTGLQRARIFSDLTELEVGDYFYIHVLGETLAYCVDQILVVEPDDVSALQIEEGMDYVTLVTCTPYGVNSHRLLVRGVRTDYEEAQKITAGTATTHRSSQWMREYVMAFATGIVLLVLIILVFQILQHIKRKNKKHVTR